MISPSNNPREAPLDSTVCHNYGVTINVYPEKRILNTIWRKLTFIDQKDIITRFVSNALDAIGKKSEDFKHVFEPTESGYAHLHGAIKCSVNEISQFQSFIHNKLGLPTAPPFRVCFIEETKVSTHFWESYMTKTQDDSIPNKSLFF